MFKTPHAQPTFWSFDIEKVHVAVAKQIYNSITQVVS